MHCIPDLNEHLAYSIKFSNDQSVAAAVSALLKLGTCFAVIGGEMEVRTTKRGAQLLAALFDPKGLCGDLPTEFAQHHDTDANHTRIGSFPEIPSTKD